MRFRQIFFWILALLALGWIILGFATGSDVSTQMYAENALETDETMRTASDLGTTLGAGIGYTFFLCTGLPFLLLFSFLAWRNGVGLREERRHQELMAAQYAQVRTMGAIADSPAYYSAPARQPTRGTPMLPPENQRQLDAAWRYIDDGDIKAARAITMQLYQRQKNNVDVLYLVSFVADKRKTQLEALHKAMTIDPHDQRVRQRLDELMRGA